MQKYSRKFTREISSLSMRVGTRPPTFVDHLNVLDYLAFGEVNLVVFSGLVHNIISQVMF